MKAILKIAQKAPSVMQVSYRGRRVVHDSSPGQSNADPVSQKEGLEDSSLRYPSMARGLNVETIGLGVKKAIHPSVAKNKLYQKDKYGE